MKVKLIILGALCFYTGLFGMEQEEVFKKLRKQKIIDAILVQLKGDVRSHKIDLEDISDELYKIYFDFTPVMLFDYQFTINFLQYYVGMDGVNIAFRKLLIEKPPGDITPILMNELNKQAELTKKQKIRFISQLEHLKELNNLSKNLPTGFDIMSYLNKWLLAKLTIKEFIAKNPHRNDIKNQNNDWTLRKSIKNEIKKICEEFNLNYAIFEKTINEKLQKLLQEHFPHVKTTYIS